MASHKESTSPKNVCRCKQPNCKSCQLPVLRDSTPCLNFKDCKLRLKGLLNEIIKNADRGTVCRLFHHVTETYNTLQFFQEKRSICENLEDFFIKTDQNPAPLVFFVRLLERASILESDSIGEIVRCIDILKYQGGLDVEVTQCSEPNVQGELVV